MLKAVKDNKVYSIEEVDKGKYLTAGYDIADENGNIIERSPSSVVTRGEYDKLLAENKKLKAEIANSDIAAEAEKSDKKVKKGEA
ncbi:MAG: hypothetical protein ACI4RN_00820 [Oscillospiraceae bacterium]